MGLKCPFALTPFIDPGINSSLKSYSLAIYFCGTASTLNTNVPDGFEQS